MAMLALDTKGYLYRSTDDGATWSTGWQPTDPDLFLQAIFSVDTDKWLIAAGAGYVKSDDDGATWSEHIIDRDHAYIAGFGTDGQSIVALSDRVYRSSDGGGSFVADGGVGLSTTGMISDPVFGNGVWLAIDYYSVIRSTDDWATWETVYTPTGTSDRVMGLAFGDGTWVASRNDGAMTSTDDGATWTFHAPFVRAWHYPNGGLTYSTHMSSCRGADYRGGLWLITAADAAMGRSIDGGATWQASPDDDGPPSGGTVSVHPWGDAWFTGYGLGASSGRIRKTTDGGITWSEVGIFSFVNDTTPYAYLADFAVPIPGNVSAATPTGAFYSYDPGTDTWTQLADGPIVSHAGSTVLDGKLYVLGGFTTAGGASEYIGVADGLFDTTTHRYNSGKLTSSDGQTWTWDDAVFPQPDGAQAMMMAYSPSLSTLVATSGSQSFYSTDGGTSWTRLPDPPAVVRSLIWAADQGVFVMGMDAANGVLTSHDGTSFGQHYVVPEAYRNASVELEALAASPTRLMVAGSFITSGQFSCWSEDGGVTWTMETQLASVVGANYPYSAVWDGDYDRFVMNLIRDATTGTGQVLTSPDGATWTLAGSIPNEALANLTWAPGISTLFGIGTGYGVYVYSSTDGGTTWTQHAAPNLSTGGMLSGLCWSDDLSQLIAWVGSVVYYSTDSGATWGSWGSQTSDVGPIRAVVWAVPGLVPTNELWCYDPTTAAWTQLQNFAGGVGLVEPSLIGHDGKLYVLGGALVITDRLMLDKTWIYDPTDDSWSASKDLVTQQAAGGGTSLSQSMYVMGGEPDYWDTRAVVESDSAPDAANDDAYIDTLQVWLKPPASISTYVPGTAGGGWAPTAV